MTTTPSVFRLSALGLTLTFGASLWGCVPCNQPADCPTTGDICATDGFCKAAGTVPVDEIPGRFSENRTSNTEIIPTPDSLELRPEYSQYTNGTGVAVVATEGVPRVALQIANDTLEFLFENNEAARGVMIADGAYHILHAADEDIPDLPTNFPGSEADTSWSIANNVVSTSRGAYLVCNFTEEGFYGSNQFVEVMARHIFIAYVIPGSPLDARISEAYEQAVAEDLWVNTVAGLNVVDYFGELSTIWLEVHRPEGPPDGDGFANQVNTREELMIHDPEGAAIMNEFYGNSFEVPGCIRRNEVVVGEDGPP